MFHLLYRICLLSLLVAFLSFGEGYTQPAGSALPADTTHPFAAHREYRGVILDKDAKTPLAYANIYLTSTGKGAISNESGHFTIDLSGANQLDTVRFQYIGYKTKHLTIRQLDTTSTVYMKEEIINLSETIIFGSVPDILSIVKNVLKYKEKNYRQTICRKQAFIRERNTVDINEVLLKYKRSTIDGLDEDLIGRIEDKFPDNVTSYTDFLGMLYFNPEEEDTVNLKIDPEKAVALKEEDIAEFDQLGEIFKDLISNTGEEEYWKVRSGIFGQKLDFGDDSLKNDQDTLRDFRNNLKIYASRVNYQLNYTTFEDKDQWEFLHKTGRYKYTLIGGSKINGEEVYIIDFEPDDSGLYTGRMYIGMNSFALIRADYAYAPGKKGTDFHLLGVGYTENQFSGSIYFERKSDNYHLKYFSYKFGISASIDRNVLLIKKKNRWLFDKTLKELKLGIELVVDTEESVEFLVLNEEALSSQEYQAFQQKEYANIIYVDQFDEDLWRGYSIIEPTAQMKEYKKQQISYKE